MKNNIMNSMNINLNHNNANNNIQIINNNCNIGNDIPYSLVGSMNSLNIKNNNMNSIINNFQNEIININNSPNNSIKSINNNINNNINNMNNIVQNNINFNMANSINNSIDKKKYLIMMNSINIDQKKIGQQTNDNINLNKQKNINQSMNIKINQKNINQQNINLNNMGNINKNINMNYMNQKNIILGVDNNNNNKQNLKFNNANNMINNSNCMNNNFNNNLYMNEKMNNKNMTGFFNSINMFDNSMKINIDNNLLDAKTEVRYHNFFDSINYNNINNNINICNSVVKLELNIIYYDENLRNKENSVYCSFFKMNVKGTFYGCDSFQLFKYILKKIKNSKKDFVLISSGRSANEIFNFCSDIQEIKYYYIFCTLINNYMILMKVYPKLKGIYNVFNLLIGALLTIPPNKNFLIKSSNLIFFDEYNKKYIKLHYEIIKKYSLYKLLKSEQFNQMKFIQLIYNKFPYYSNLANELLSNEKEMIEFFKKNTNENEELIKSAFNCNHNIKNYISLYTFEGFYYKYLNKFLREGDFDNFKILSSYISKFIYHLYEYRKNNKQKHETSILFRNMYITPEELNIYVNSLDKVICYPSFTSTSLKENTYNPIKKNADEQYVKLLIEQNNSKSVVSIGEISQNPDEKEYLFIPFSFFKIINVKISRGNENDPHIIHLMAVSSEESIEEMILKFMKNETDNLDPEGLDILKLVDFDTKIVINSELKSFNI